MSGLDLAARRRFYAEEIQMTSNLKSADVVEAFATVPREQFLPAGPWTVKGEADFQGAPRQTPDADPRHVYHNIGVAIDPSRLLFNGAPGVLGLTIDSLAPAPGRRVLHLGTGLGYYTAILAQSVGPTGRVVGLEVDPGFAAAARKNLASFPWVDVRESNGTGPLGETFDAILINAGVTHPQASWLDALAPGGRMVLPITASMPGMGPIGKGPMVMITRGDDAAVFTARVITFIAIYSGIGLREPAIEAELGKSLMRNPFPPLKTFRREPHDAGAACWLHTEHGCLST